MIIYGGTASTPMAGHVVTDDTKVSKSPWSSKGTVDKLCPSFEESGTAVRCEPVEGYPLQVVSNLPESVDGYTSASISHGGKNILDPEAYKKASLTDGRVSLSGDIFTVNFTSGGVHVNQNFNSKRVVTQPGTYTISFTPVNTTSFGLTVILYRASDKSQISFSQLTASGAHHYTFTVNEPFIISIAGNSAYYGQHSFRVQLEVGSTATDYEAFTAPDVHSVSFPQISGGTFDWSTGKLTDVGGAVSQYEPQQIVAKPSVNTIISETGEVQVSGKADPVRVIENLTNAIIALGGNI